MPQLLTHEPLVGMVLSQMYGDFPTAGIVPHQFGTDKERIVWEYGDYQHEGHTGWDGKARLNQAVYSAASGRLDFSGEAVDMPDWVADKYMHARGAAAWPSGRCAFMDHGDGKGTTYSHFEAVAPIRDGTWIDGGVRIGGAGMTGRSTGIHLHFEVILLPAPNKPHMYGRVDPLQWFTPGKIFQIRPGEEGSAAVQEELIPGVSGLYK